MAIKSKLLVGGVVLALLGASHYVAYLKGWYAHSEKVNSEAKAKSKKAEKAVATGEQKAAAANAEGKVIYRTIYRDVVKYVNDPNHTKCDFDDHAVQLRQRALDAANSISGFDAGTVQGSKQSGN
ncbi:hypothetical protein [Citrobacter meridianamericanus]|uniref:hypothetical protein n=1 Tax=Citrobacter meridianamericanus TaxID=2894201 RepID=UPI00351CF330